MAFTPFVKSDRPSMANFNAKFLALLEDSGARPNLLDNWYFPDPVNQRGQTEYTGGGRTIDRWRGSGYTAESARLTGTGLLVQNGRANGNAFFRQEFDTPLPAGIYTVSVLVGQLTGSAGVYLANAQGNYIRYAALKSGLTTVTAELEEGFAARLQFTVGAGAAVELIAAKVEMGSGQTLAHQQEDGSWTLNAPPPRRAAELAQCQRYFERITAAGTNLSFAMGCGTAAKLYCGLKLSPKRIVPVAGALAACLPFLRYGTTTLTETPTGVSIYSFDCRTGCGTLELTGAFTAGAAYRVGIVAGGYLDFDSEVFT